MVERIAGAPLGSRTDDAYRELRERAPDLYRRAVQVGFLVTCRADHEDDLTIAAKVERSVVSLLLDAVDRETTPPTLGLM